MNKILVSRCLLGDAICYDGKHRKLEHPKLMQWLKENRIIPACPEVLGGLSIPRAPAELQGGDGSAVLKGQAKVITIDGEDVTDAYIKGAQKVLRLAQKNGATIALLKFRSPACGNKQIYDGSYSHTLIAGQGVATALLTQHGIKVYDETEIDKIEL